VLTCNHCAETLEQALSQVSGVRSAQVSYPAQHASVAFEAGVQADTIIKAIQAKGY